ncbi:hypothetical protein DL237_00135 [Pseudooceanicola sediminis]|uniref:Pentapeptide repeat-containing protein n=1 Tax=Pseudooceanicola sediminis TaxID=2211117 RepID=A0A399J4U3_9RHOB|nr:hypothetical protein [Pseudooceanicola sediminis]KAA2317177.1 hypothetical protein E0K93_02405 [Puniceibacterium sp. HSS470]RII40473.1 hypothetical protein DL237_00135 [Pseudooceanicola sediminis]|tara:strand:- start:57181 stop:57684 length:504 start_codon:yes stop_codon:yes gene_type:complete
MTPHLSADCSQCAALCCLALALDAGDSFAIDKPAGLPCPNLAGHACSIHAELTEKGYPGCVAYDCLGAGQRVTQELFDGLSWRDAPKLAGPMITAFAGMRAIHQRLELLVAAATLPLSDSDEEIRKAHLGKLSDRLEPQIVAAFPGSAAESAIDAFVRSLRRYVSRG